MDLVAVNVTLDYLFVMIYIFLVSALVLHFGVGVLKGRARKKWIEGKWPEHDHVPPPAPKLMHAVHMSMMIILGFSGMYIRFPFFDGGRIAMRYVHYAAMIIVTIILLMRTYYAFRSKTNADWREFAVTREDLASTVGVLLYYTYFSDNKPHVAKYNVMQKLAYLMFWVMMFVMALSGFSLVTKPLLFGTSPRDWIVGWNLGILLGSVDLAGWYMRMLHYILNWLFIILTTVHVYLSASEDVPVTLDFFGIKELQVVEGHGHGHGHDDAHADDTPSGGVTPELGMPYPE